MMQLFYHQSKEGNFGDDINAWLWQEILPDCWQKESETLFVGIGTILNENLPVKKGYIVFGSGIGYKSFKRDIHSSSWNVCCVRGPMSATILDLDSHKFVTDSALLVREVFNVVPLKKRSGIVFVPHISTVKEGGWAEVCRKAGMQYVDPRQDSKIVINAIANAELVIADAMHAAILADAMRVPWIPVMTTVEINTFKWLDWTQSMEVAYQPVLLPQSSIWEMVKNIFLVLRDESQTLFRSTVNAQKQLVLPNNATEIALEYYRKKLSVERAGFNKQRQKWVRRFYSKIVSPLLSLSLVQRILAPLDRMKVNRAAKFLQQVAQYPTYLSDEKVCHEKLQQLKELLEEVKKQN